MATSGETPVLYSYWRSSCSWRVRIGLAWKGIEYANKPVHLLTDGGEHLKEEFTKMNPNQRLPALIIDGHTLTQSAAILEYLEETHPEKPLLPTDPLQRAQVRTICQIIGADIQPIQNLAVMNKVVEDLPAEEKAAQKVAWGKFWIQRGFVGLEQELARTAGKFCVGDTITMADLFLEPQVYNANRFGVDMSQFPVISRISAELSQLAEFQAAHPSNQPDAQ
ncbi:hypothetical protein Poli38472_002214 [Pythium oligandrum]|uniref:Maleylacetoacetate isomerase n=1 Tax=Pythium oligandrum TaxID=41045 RepID=A0A8K1CHW3_PYTOL|nr:hypothetical protein Poli38472_002214 [Pythium oligandrum]|eukprot:TMW63273.1 hypothetical protein Poli38472_002214 [Pythium oligandrum]